MKVKSIAECSKWSILQSFRPSLSYKIFIKVKLFTTKKDGSTGPTALESNRPYFEIMGQWPGPTIDLKAWIKYV